MEAKLTLLNILNYLDHDLKFALKEEIAGYIKANKDRDVKAEEIITYNEIAILSLVKSAIVRGKKPDLVWAIQEYQVSGVNKRADLFCMFREKEGGLNCDLLFEAKWIGEYSPNINHDDMGAKEKWKEVLRKTQKQGEEYFEAERVLFFEPSYLITIYFETLMEKHLKEYEKLKPIKLEDSFCYQFPIQPINSSRILYVYGHVKQLKP